MPLDPTLAQLLELGRAAPPTSSLAPAEARAAMRDRVAPLAALAPAGVRVEPLTMPGPGGDLTLRLVRPPGTAVLPLVLFLHGGGWVVCDLDTHEPQARRMALGADVAVLMVDYRLAPEHPFPAAIDDSLAALDWAIANAALLRADPARIAVAGDSAGGNLAAVVARERATTIRGQWLIYPVAAYPDAIAYPSYAHNGEGYGLTAADMRWYWRQYLGHAGPSADPRAALLGGPVAGAPPALVQTAEYDVLRDEGEAYARQLDAAGVAVTLTRHAGMIHGFLALAGMVAGADAAMAEGCDWLRQTLA